mmetsp:Transcript_32797/g.57100  ORF Transcript_32797/g.57100 Transcript_32797/m.57100 type:complete len:148 (-) Transcript_32797:2063-2506(-)
MSPFISLIMADLKRTHHDISRSPDLNCSLVRASMHEPPAKKVRTDLEAHPSLFEHAQNALDQMKFTPIKRTHTTTSEWSMPSKVLQRKGNTLRVNLPLGVIGGVSFGRPNATIIPAADVRRQTVVKKTQTKRCELCPSQVLNFAYTG